MAYPESITLPGLVDMHVHPRDFAQSDKETFETCSRAAIMGGVVLFGAMPNYEPDLEVRPYNLENMRNLHRQASGKIWCDVAMYAAAQPHHDNVGQLEHVLPWAVGTKFYVEPTQGNDTRQDVAAFKPAAERIHELAPTKIIIAHVEDDTIEDAIGLIAQDIGHPLLVPHVNNRFVLDKIIAAKKKGLPVMAELTPHHATMTQDDIAELGWRARMKPPLGAQEDQDYLWVNLDAFDIIGTDHAPHTITEKDEADMLNPEGKTGPDDKKCYGVPGVEAMLPLMLKAVDEDRLTYQRLTELTSTRPREILGLPADPSSTVTVTLERREFTQADVVSKCGWSPYIGKPVVGRVGEVTLRGQTVFQKCQFIGEPQGAVLAG
jgi:carbamoyl-phosphate synthase/aspartate carbamoyltransferase/dihydroorotase